jgi:hypothetical protein
MLMTWIAILAAAILFSISVLHFYWAFGGRWPGTDDNSLAQTVIGGDENTPLPSSLACTMVAAGLLMAAWITLAAQDIVPPVSSGAVNRVAAFALAGVLGLRGLGGFLETRLRPEIQASPYARLNVRLYSPLCLMLAGLVFLAAWNIPN